MKFVTFSVSKYRSITSAHKIPISDSTILIGKNNEGKSNLLHALDASMSFIQWHARAPRARSPLRSRWRSRRDIGTYDWGRDFPISLQSRKGRRETVFRLEFELSAHELLEFKNEIKSNLNGLLPIEIRIGRDHGPSFTVVKKGRGGKTLSKKSSKIANFIGRRIVFAYIPTIRTAEAAISVVKERLDDELLFLEEEPEYKNALSKIAELQQPILDGISRKIFAQLKEFIPQISSVEVTISEEDRYRALRRQCEVSVDDGTLTRLEMKGDGVKSLAALSLLRGARKAGVSSILALEEPESHLHPSAIHRLREVIQDLAQENQVVITTHCPLFVDRTNIATNIVVTNRRAKPAKTISEIRDLLGVKTSDNLTHANIVLLVEGRTDVQVLRALLSHYSTKLERAIKSNTLVVDSMGGAGKLSYQLSLLNAALCRFQVFLDHDDAGRNAAIKAKNDRELQAKDCHHAICRGQEDSELEDMIAKDLYEAALSAKFGVKLTPATFNNNSKWSERMRSTFRLQGKLWNEVMLREVKNMIVELVAAAPDAALIESKRSSFDSLLKSLEEKVEESKAT